MSTFVVYRAVKEGAEIDSQPELRHLNEQYEAD